MKPHHFVFVFLVCAVTLLVIALIGRALLNYNHNHAPTEPTHRIPRPSEIPLYPCNDGKCS